MSSKRQTSKKTKRDFVVPRPPDQTSLPIQKRVVIPAQPHQQTQPENQTVIRNLLQSIESGLSTSQVTGSTPHIASSSHEVPPPRASVVCEAKHGGTCVIHSGHFMRSAIHDLEGENEEDDDEDAEIDVVSSDTEQEATKAERKLALAKPIVVRPQIRRVRRSSSSALGDKTTSEKGDDERPVTFYKFGPKKTRSIAIDVSLGGVNKRLNFAYNQLTTPKWKNFSGLRLSWKERIRLNNVIWRSWHMEFITRQRPRYCAFSLPNDERHNCAEAAVLEGMYWKRRHEALSAQYKRWRIHKTNAAVKKRRLRHRSSKDSITPTTSGDNIKIQFGEEADTDPILIPLRARTHSMSNTGMGGSSSVVGWEEDDYDNCFTDRLFESLSQTSYMFPNPKEMAHPKNALFIQPSLIQLQPSLEEIMASFDSPLTGDDPELSEFTIEKITDDLRNSYQPQSMDKDFMENTEMKGVPESGDQFQRAASVEPSAELNSPPYYGPRKQYLMADKNYQMRLAAEGAQSAGASQSLSRSGTDLTYTQANYEPTNEPFLDPYVPQMMSNMGDTSGLIPHTSNMACLPISNKAAEPQHPYGWGSGSQKLPTTLHSDSQDFTPQPPIRPPSKGALKAFPPGATGETVPLKKQTRTRKRATKEETERKKAKKSVPEDQSVPPPLISPSHARAQIGNLIQNRARAPGPSAFVPIGLGAGNNVYGPGGPRLPTGTPFDPSLLNSHTNQLVYPPNSHILSTQPIVSSPLLRPPNVLPHSSGNSQSQPLLLVQPCSTMSLMSVAVPVAYSTVSTSSTTLSPRVLNTSVKQEIIDKSSPFSMKDYNPNEGSPSTSGASTSGLSSPASQPSRKTKKPTKRAAADSTVDPMERKRMQHLHAEQSRRSALKGGFEQLEDLLPDFTKVSGTKNTNAVVLARTADYIRKLQIDIEAKKKERTENTGKVQNLQERIQAHQTQLPAAGTGSSSSSRVIESQYNRFVADKSKQDWRFWLLSKVIEPLFQSYNKEVEGKKRSEILGSAQQWAAQNCNAINLRPAASKALVEIATETPMMTSPKDMDSWVKKVTKS